MALFNFGKKKEEKKETGCYSGSIAPKARKAAAQAGFLI